MRGHFYRVSAKSNDTMYEIDVRTQEDAFELAAWIATQPTLNGDIDVRAVEDHSAEPIPWTPEAARRFQMQWTSPAPNEEGAGSEDDSE